MLPAIRLIGTAVVCSWAMSVAHSQEAKFVTTFQDHLPAECTTFMYVGDLSVPLQRLAKSKLIIPLIQDFKSRDPERFKTSPMQMLEQIEAYKQYFPTELAAGFPSTAYIQFTRANRLVLLYSILKGAQIANDTGGLKSFENQLISEVGEFKFPRVVIYAKFRDNTVPAQAMALAQAQAAGIGQKYGLKTETGDNFITVTFKVGNVFPPQVITPLIQHFEIFQEDDGTKATSLAEAISSQSIEASLEKINTGLKLTVGENSRRISKPLSSRPMNKLWKSSPELIYYAQWDISALRNPWEALVKDWQSWKYTPAGHVVSENESQGFFGDIELLQGHFAHLSSRGSARATITETLDATIHEEDFPPSPSLAELEIATLFPKGCTLMTATSMRLATELIEESLSRFESRMSVNSFRPGLRGEAANEMLDAYYDRLKGLRDLVLQEAPNIFAPGFAMLTSTGHLEEMRLTFSDGQENTLTDMPITEFALIGRRQAGNQAARDFYANLYKSFYSLSDKPLNEPVVEERDLKLGVPAYVFLPLFEKEFRINLNVKGDVLPHYFVLGDWVVFSTSPRLSQAIVGAARSEAQEVKLPTQPSKLVALGWISSEAIAQYFGDILIVAGLVIPRPEGSVGVDGFGEFFRTFKHIKWMTTETEDLRATNYRMVFAK
jgi:hypothetical protein